MVASVAATVRLVERLWGLLAGAFGYPQLSDERLKNKYLAHGT